MSQNVKFDSISTVRIGGASHRDRINEANRRGDIEINHWALEILEKTEHLLHHNIISVVAIRLRLDLPKESKEKTLRPMYEEALKNGLCLCPAVVGLEMLIQRGKNIDCEARLAMKPVPCVSSEQGEIQENVLAITNRKCQLGDIKSLYASPASLDEFADAGMTYLFCEWNPILKNEGFASL